jgi:hypothetical protein
MVNLQRFSRCLNCLESFTSADNTPKMADFGLREKGYRVVFQKDNNVQNKSNIQKNNNIELRSHTCTHACAFRKGVYVEHE